MKLKKTKLIKDLLSYDLDTITRSGGWRELSSGCP